MFQLPEVNIGLVLTRFVCLLLPVEVRNGFEVFLGVATGDDFLPRAEQQWRKQIALDAEWEYLDVGVEVGVLLDVKGGRRRRSGKRCVDVGVAEGVLFASEFYQLVATFEVVVLVPGGSFLLEGELLFFGELAQEFRSRRILAFVVCEVIVIDGEVQLVYSAEKIPKSRDEIVGAFLQRFLAGEHLAFGLVYDASERRE